MILSISYGIDAPCVRNFRLGYTEIDFKAAKEIEISRKIEINRKLDKT